MSTSTFPPLDNEHDPVLGVERHETRTRWVVALTAVVMVIEIVVGQMTGSMALLADGWHMATHVAALGFSAFAYWFARTRSGHRSFTFGTGKVYALAGYTSAFVLGFASLFMVFESGRRLFSPVQIHFDEALGVAVLGLVANLLSAWLLGSGTNSSSTDVDDHDHSHHDAHAHGHAHGGHGHAPRSSASHGHAHGSAALAGHGHAHGDANHRAAYLHVIADALTSVLAIVALLAARFLEWTFLDPVMGIVGGLVVAKWALSLCLGAARQLQDVCSSETDEDRVRAVLEGVDDVRVLDLHVWEMGPGRRGCVLSLVTSEPREVAFYRELIRSTTPLSHLTVEVHRAGSAT